MRAFLIGFAVCAGPTIAWHMRAKARCYDTPALPSGSETSAVAAAGARPGPDGPDRCLRFTHARSATVGNPHPHPVLCLKPTPCTGPHAVETSQERP